MIFDLHCHTRISDGRWDTIEVESYLKQYNDIFCITDHDVINTETSGERIRGIELTVKDKTLGSTYHILLYNYDMELALNELSIQHRNILNAESKKLNNMVIKAIKAGIEIPIDLCLGEHNTATKVMFDKLKSIGDPLALDSYYEFCDSLEKETHPLHTKSDIEGLTDIEQVLELRDRIGGKLYLAHPFKYPKRTRDYVLDIAVNKLDGIECLHPTASEQESIELLELCIKEGLLASGGSDWHQTDLYLETPNIHLANSKKYSKLFAWITKGEKEHENIIEISSGKRAV